VCTRYTLTTAGEVHRYTTGGTQGVYLAYTDYCWRSTQVHNWRYTECVLGKHCLLMAKYTGTRLEVHRGVLGIH